MKKILMAAAGLVAISAPALAADMAPAPRPYTKAPVVVAPIFNWTGFYIGGSRAAHPLIARPHRRSPPAREAPFTTGH